MRKVSVLMKKSHHVFIDYDIGIETNSLCPQCWYWILMFFVFFALSYSSKFLNQYKGRDNFTLIELQEISISPANLRNKLCLLKQPNNDSIC